MRCGYVDAYLRDLDCYVSDLHRFHDDVMRDVMRTCDTAVPGASGGRDTCSSSHYFGISSLTASSSRSWGETSGVIASSSPQIFREETATCKPDGLILCLDRFIPIELSYSPSASASCPVVPGKNQSKTCQKWKRVRSGRTLAGWKNLEKNS